MKKIFIASDHGGYELKEYLKGYLKKSNYEIEDLGTNSNQSVNYPDYASKLSNEVIKNDTLGILICGTGIGMSIAANKVDGIRAALVDSVTLAKLSRAHNNANVLCMGGRILGNILAEEIVDSFLTTEFEGGRHQNRLDIISSLE
jgi:ribose 5-phosphate isomerase B